MTAGNPRRRAAFPARAARRRRKPSSKTAGAVCSIREEGYAIPPVWRQTGASPGRITHLWHQTCAWFRRPKGEVPAEGLPPPDESTRSAAARRRSAVQALVAGARADRDGPAVGARRRVCVDEGDLLHAAPTVAVHLRRGDDLERAWARRRVRLFGSRLGLFADDDPRLLCVLERQGLARHPPE